MPILIYPAKKRFGQNFLIDNSVISHIIAAIDPKTDDHLVEIGPGYGALTAQIAAGATHFTAIELDKDLFAVLRAQLPNVNLIQADALKFDYQTLVQKQPLRIFGNLPYNLSSPLLFYLLGFNEVILDMTFMLQKEMADRLTAQPGTRLFGRLSVMIQYSCQVTKLFDIPPTAFKPKPRVWSTLVKLTPYRALPHPIIKPTTLEFVARQAFSHRRKTLKNNFKQYLSLSQWQLIDIDNNRRPEQLSLMEFIKICQLFEEVNHV